MKFITPIRSVFRQFVFDAFNNKRTDAQTGPGSDIEIDSDSVTSVGMEIFRLQRQLISWLWGQTSDGDSLEDHLYAYGLPDGDDGYGGIKESITDSVADAVAVTSTDTSVDIDGYQLTDAAGTVFAIDQTYTGVAAPGGTENVDLVSVTKGTIANIPSGTALTFTSPPANIDADAVTVANMTGAVDDETPPEGRARLLTRTQRSGLSGNADDIREIIEGVNPGVFVAQVYEQRDGYPYGWLTVDVTAYYADEDRTDSIISAADKALILAALEAKLPADQYDNLRFLDVIEEALDVEAEWILDPDAPATKATDFDSETLDAEAAAWTDGAIDWVRCNKAIDAVITKGDWVIINSARAKVGEVGAASVGGANTDFDVDSDFHAYDADINPFPWPAGYGAGVLPGANPKICSGGGVAEAIFAATFAYFRTIGCTKESGTAAALADWDGLYLKEREQAAIIGADDSIISTGYINPANTEPTDPLTTDIPRIMVGELIFHETK